MGKRVRLEGWQTGLLRKIKPDGSTTNVLRPILANASLILSSDPKWEGVLAYDEFAETVITQKLPPFRPCDLYKGQQAGDWVDEDTGRTQAWLSDAWGLDVGQDVCLSAVKMAACRRRVHPVRDWLDSLRWDGKMRSASWLIDVMGCEDTPYVRAVGQAWLVSAVARVYNPGCKVDTVLVLEGKPGIFKSSVLRALVGEWFLEMSITDVANKDAMQTLRRKWIAEFPEIDGLSRTEQAHVKAYFSRQVDTYRASYGKGTRDYPRQTVFAATTNKEQYLVDETGGSGRRMWPVRCHRGDLGLAGSLREQLWAEAKVRFEGGQEWHLRDPELRDLERSEQDARFRSDPWEQTIATWLAKPSDLGDKTIRGVSTADVMAGALGMDVAKRDHASASRVGAILRRIGWLPGKHPETIDGVRIRLYRPEDGAGTNGHTLWPLEDSGTVPLESDELSEDMFPPKDSLG
jgi:putative DNA primase/helicase